MQISVSALVGILSAFLTTLITNWFNVQKESRQKRIESLENQIRELYGPLSFLLSQVEAIFQANKALLKMGNALNNTAVIPFANSHIEKITPIRREIFTLIKQKAHFLDADDFVIVQKFSFHHERFETEITNPTNSENPNIYKEIGQDLIYLKEEDKISFLPQIFIDTMKQKIQDKHKRLLELTASSRSFQLITE